MNNESYWQKTTTLPHYPKIKQDCTYDIVIVGGGMSGITLAHRLNDSNFNGAVITESERDKLISLVNFYKTKKVSDSNYQALLNSIIEDITSLTNRNSTQIKEFLAS